MISQIDYRRETGVVRKWLFRYPDCMTEMKILYSWQSDLPNPVNRGFIENVLENVAKEIRSDESLMVDPVIDRDTLGLTGSPDITAAILSKIDNAVVVVCDVSIINERSKFKSTPNPNVMFEMGYALKSKDWNRIIMVVNEAFGKVEKLPFDLPKRRAITYSLNEGQDKTNARLILHGKLKAHIKEIIGEVTVQQEPPISERVEIVKTKAELLAEEHEFQSQRSQWRSSTEGTDEARNNSFTIYEEIQRLFELDREHNDLMKNECNRGVGNASSHLSLVHRGTMAFNLSWAQYYANELDTAGILLEVKNIGVRTDRQRKKRYRADLDRQKGLVWFEESQKDHKFTSLELAADLYDAFLDEIRVISTPQ